ncbi:MAG: outer membrane protein assembly factor BamD [Proteobacteria bacterium]|nr:outer membrane protein assembly factor BamD [Pseudomonadota bacterium]
MKIKLSVFIIILGILFSCAKKTPTPEEAYKDALSLYTRKSYEDSVEAFKKVKELFPDHPLSIEAQIMSADAYFKAEKYDEAYLAYDEFIKLYPENINIPYAHYKQALCYYNQISEKDRDQSFTRLAIEKLDKVLSDFPDTPYAVKAYFYKKECRKRLAEQEIFVGNFYLRYDKYKSAEKRFLYALKNFPDIPIQEEALFGLYKVYRGKKEIDKINKVADLIFKHFPDTKYKEKIKKEVPNEPQR